MNSKCFAFFFSSILAMSVFRYLFDSGWSRHVLLHHRLIPSSTWYSFYRPRNDARLSQLCGKEGNTNVQIMAFIIVCRSVYLQRLKRKDINLSQINLPTSYEWKAESALTEKKVSQMIYNIS